MNTLSHGVILIHSEDLLSTCRLFSAPSNFLDRTKHAFLQSAIVLQMD